MIYFHEPIVGLEMNVALLPIEEQPPRRRFTVDDVLRMQEAGVFRDDENFELIEGELVMMSAKYAPHEVIKTALIRELIRFVGDALDVAVESSLRLAHDTFVEPDITVLAHEVFVRSGHALTEPRPEDIRLLIEISDSRLAYDRQVKAQLYARFGIREFWVVDAKERVTWIYTGPSGEGWTSIIQRKEDEMLASTGLPGFTVCLKSIVSRL